MSIDQIPIGRFSVITRLSQKALRYYDQKDLLVPQAKDVFTGYRYYKGNQIQQGIKIKHLSDLGLSIDEIRKYLEAEKNKEEDKIAEILEKRLRNAENELVNIQRVVGLLRNPKEVVKNTMSKPIIKKTPPLRVLSKREKGTYQVTIGKLIIELIGIIQSPDNQRNFVKITGPFMSIYHDEEHVEEGADIEVAVPVTGRIVVEDPNVEIRNLKPLKVASLVYKGSYESIGEGYSKLFNYILENKLTPNGFMMDLYLNDPNSVNPDDILTEIQMPIK
jgi:effector-binding domain-containing protein